MCKDSDNILRTLSSLSSQLITRIADVLAAGCFKAPKPTKLTIPPVVDTCDNLKTGKEYYLKTSDGQFAVVEATNKLGFIRRVNPKRASKFTATKVGCNLYGLCVNGFCMSRCMACQSNAGDLQTVKFHLVNSNEAYSRWTFSSAGSKGEYNLKVDGSYGYLTYKKTLSDNIQLTLSTQLSNETKFQFVEVELEKKWYDVKLVAK